MERKTEIRRQKGKCRELLAMHPWFQTVIFAIDKKAFSEFFFRKFGRKIQKYDAVKSIWQIMGVSLLGKVIPHIKKLVPDDPWGCLNVRNIAINNPKGRNKSAIENVIKSKFSRTPEFVLAGHYGIDALGGVLWAFHRCLNLGKVDCLPRSVQNFNKDFYIFVSGVVSEKLTLLQNMRDINKLKNDSHL